jgi:Type II secretion system (T2SS), protein E, N-terminal domain
MPFLSHKPDAPEDRAGRFERMRRLGVEAWLGLAPDHYTPGAARPERSGVSDSDARGFSSNVRGSGNNEAAARDVVFLQEALSKGCSNPDCRQGRGMPWRSRRRLVFEGRFGCKGGCIESMIRAAIAREGTERRRGAVLEPHRHRVPLGLILLSQGWITHPQLQKALEAQRRAGTGRIGDWLVSECGLDGERVTRALGVQWNCPVLRGDGFSPQAMATVLPRVLVKEYGILPLRIAGGKILYLGFKAHLDASVAFATERMSGLRIESGVVSEGEFEAARARLLACSFPAAYGKAVPDSDALAAHVAMVLEQRQAVRSKLVRLHQYYWLRVWSSSEPGGVAERREEVSDFLFTIRDAVMGMSGQA